jgi:hypothetical protein
MSLGWTPVYPRPVLELLGSAALKARDFPAAESGGLWTARIPLISGRTGAHLKNGRSLIEAVR